MLRPKFEYDLMLEDLKFIKEVFKLFGLRWCLFFGTLLGAVREGDFIMNDLLRKKTEDIDVIILQPTPKDISFKLIECFTANGYQIYKPKELPMKLMMGTRRIDIWAMGSLEKRNTPDYYYVKHFPFHKRFFESLKTAKIRDIECPIPNFAEELLENIYGSTWRIPQGIILSNKSLLRLEEKQRQGL